MASVRRRWRTDGLDLGLQFRETLPLDYPPPVPIDRREPTDSVLYRGAPPVFDDREEPDSDTVRRFPTTALGELHVCTDTSHRDVRRKSVGWLGSIALHVALVVLIALLMAPADFGGLTNQTLIVTLSEEPTEFQAPMLLVDQNSSDDASLQSDLEVVSEKMEPVEVSIDVGRPSIKIGGLHTTKGRSNGSTSGGSRGSFFGIEAVGQEFVYIVDRSGSMNGRRYRRAIDELKRSVRELRPDQRFLVVLFSSSTKTMLGASSKSAEMLQATDENKRKLEDWLATIGAGGGTNPNSSLRMAMRIKPSAVFMLSDGEFQESKGVRRGGLLVGGGDAYSIVAASKGVIPVHAIAFEDPRSCRNMKRLAEVSGGEYRFITAAGKTQSQLVAEARDLVKQPKSAARLDDQRSLARDFGASPIAASAKRSFAELLVEEYESTYGTIAGEASAKSPPDLEELVVLIESLVTIDPRRVACADLLDGAAGELSRVLHLPDNQAQRETICDRLLRLPRWPAADQLLNRLADHFESFSGVDSDVAFERLRLANALHPDSDVTPICQAICDEISHGIIDQAAEFEKNGDLVSAIKTLRQSQVDHSSVSLRSVTGKALHELTMGQLVQARDARLERDVDRENEINESLQRGFEDDPLLPVFRKQLIDRETLARRLMMQTRNSRRYSDLRGMRQSLLAVVRQYPETIAAKNAKEQLKQLPSLEAARDEEEAELIRVMDETRRR